MSGRPSPAVPMSGNPDLLIRHGVPNPHHQDIHDERPRKPFNWATGFVGLGLVGTTWALVGGLRAMLLGNKYKSQNYMRARVLCQGFSVVSLLIGLSINNRQKSESQAAAKRQFFEQQEAMKKEHAALGIGTIVEVDSEK